jgi:ABC-type phosphate transport system permease subunit
MVQKTRDVESEQGEKVESEKAASKGGVHSSGSSNSASWSSLESRYRNLWRARNGKGLKKSSAKFGILVGLLAIFGSFGGMIMSSFLGVALVMYESYKGNIDKFVSAHMGMVAGIPSVILAFSLILSASTIGQSVVGLSIATMYLILYPILYYIYSDIGTELGKRKKSGN